MKTQELIGPDRIATVELSAGEYQVRLALWLAQEFTGGDLVRLAENATPAVQGGDALSLSYDCKNWLSAVASGALYAFRSLKIPRQRVILSELSGRLRASDMDAVANGSAIAIAELANKALPGLPAQGMDSADPDLRATALLL